MYLYIYIYIYTHTPSLVARHVVEDGRGGVGEQGGLAGWLAGYSLQGGAVGGGCSGWV